jgi:two-component system sensor histidine kinase BaeS
LVVAIVVVALAVLSVSYVSTFVLVRRSLEQNALNDLKARADDLRTTVNDLVTNDALKGGTASQRLARGRVQLRAALRLSDMRAVYVTPSAQIVAPGAAEFFQLPPGISEADLLPRALRNNEMVTGRRGKTVFLAEPVRVVGDQTLVVVATSTVETTVLSRAFPLMLVGGLLLVAAVAGIAIWLARRLTRPIAAIEHAASQLAAGDLSARAGVPNGTDDELVALAGTLNHMASQLETARGSERAFLLSISHDLRTPLTSIRGYAEALADGTLDDAAPDERRRAATVIGAEARRLERLVRDLLDLSRLDSRQFSLRPRPCDATEVVRDAASAFVPQAADVGVTIAIAPGAPLPVDLDPERLAQIVANLVENALKYAATTVTVYAAEHGPGRVAVVVADDGPGIPSDQIALVFERLYTVRDTPGRAVGTGLGLAIVRELAAAMGGTALVEAPPEGGSRFVVSLPTNVPAPTH